MYKFIGGEFKLNFDRMKFRRETYDILTFAMNLGGLFRALTFVGGILTGWYSKFNGIGWILNMLFVESTPRYHLARSKRSKETSVKTIKEDFS